MRAWINLIVIEDYIYREINNRNECPLRTESYVIKPPKAAIHFQFTIIEIPIKKSPN